MQTTRKLDERKVIVRNSSQKAVLPIGSEMTEVAEQLRRSLQHDPAVTLSQNAFSAAESDSAEE